MSALHHRSMVLDDDLAALVLAAMDHQTPPRPDPQASAAAASPAATAAAGSPSPPPLPQRNAARASRFLDALLGAAKTDGNEVAVAADTQTMDEHKPTPHDVYLSSEEDASSVGEPSSTSSSSDELDFYDDDWDTDVDIIDIQPEVPAAAAPGAPGVVSRAASPVAATPLPPPPPPPADDLPDPFAPRKPPARRHSHDTARVVSVVFAGKPSLVDLTVERAARRRSLQERGRSSATSTPAPAAPAPAQAPPAPAPVPATPAKRLRGMTRSLTLGRRLHANNNNNNRPLPPSPPPPSPPSQKKATATTGSMLPLLPPLPLPPPPPPSLPASPSRPAGFGALRRASTAGTAAPLRSTSGLTSSDRPPLPSPTFLVTPPPGTTARKVSGPTASATASFLGSLTGRRRSVKLL